MPAILKIIYVCVTWRPTGSDQSTNVYPRDAPSLLRAFITYAPIAKWIVYGNAVILFVNGCLSLCDPPFTFVIFIHSSTTAADSVSNPNQIYFTAEHSFVQAYGVGSLSLKNRYNDSSRSGLFKNVKVING